MSDDDKDNFIELNVIDHDLFKDFHLDFKQFNLLIGKNGSGKSTFLKMLHILFSGATAFKSGSLRVKCGETNFITKYPVDADQFSTVSVQYIPESRYHPDNVIRTGPLGSVFDSRRPYDRIAYSDTDLKKYNEIISSIFGRTLRAKPTQDGTKMFYDKNANLVEPRLDGYGIVNINPIIQTLMTTKNSIILIEEIEENLHPAAIKKFLNFVFAIATTNNNILFITSHSIMTVLEFTHRRSDDAERFTVTRFKENENNMELSQLNETNMDKFLEDFFGSFPDIQDVKILRKLSAFKRDI